MTSGILVVQFQKPVSVAVDRLGPAASEYIGAARRDPDGRALRFALTQKVKVSTMVAGDRLFVDLLPESWQGEPPPLPREVVEELAKKANEAERLTRLKAAAEEVQRNIPSVRVRVAMQPTFTRYIFDLPELTGVTAERGKDKLTLAFGRALRFDLSDAKLAGSKTVEAIDATGNTETSQVQFKFAKTADIRTFREDSNFVVDVSPIDAKPVAGPLAGVTAPETIPATTKPGEAAPHAAAAAPKASTAEEPATSPPPVAQAKPEPAPAKPDRPVTAEMRRQGDGLRLYFPFDHATPAAVFQRADTLWLVFDTKVAIDTDIFANDPSKTIRSAEVAEEDGAQVVKLVLQRPRLVSVEPQDNGWLVSIGEALAGQGRALIVARNIVGPGRSSIAIPFTEPAKKHWLDDAETGVRLLVVTGLGPSRGLLKGQDFVDLRALPSSHGIAVEPFVDDLKVELSVDKVLLARPPGLTLSDATMPQEQQLTHAMTFDSKAWQLDREADYTKRQFDLVRVAASAPFTGRTAARLNLARFYLARQFYPEAKSVLDMAIAEDKPTVDDPAPLVLRAVANIMLDRADAAQKDLANPVVGNQNDAPLWRALALARAGKWAEARDAFRSVDGALSALPLELQRMALKEGLRAAVETGDVVNASTRLNEFKIVGLLAGHRTRGVGAERTAGRARRPHPGGVRRLSPRGQLHRCAFGGAGPAPRRRAPLFHRRGQPR